MKQTEIGEIPVEWEVVKLGDIISDLKSGVSVNSEDKRVSSDEEIGILKTSAVANGRFLHQQHKLVVEKDVQRAKLNPIEGSILISRMNTPALVGDSCYVERNYPNLFIPDRLWMTVFNPKKKISSRWLSFVLVSDSFKEIIRNTATGTSNSMKNISKGSFLSLELPLPPLSEQRKMAEILSTLDEKMAVMDEQLVQTQELKKGLMQRLLTKGIGHTQFKDSPLGEIPATWETIRVGKVAKLQGGFAFKSTDAQDAGVKWLKIANVSVGEVDWRAPSFLPFGFEAIHRNFLLEKGDIVIAMTRPILGDRLKIAVINDDSEPILLNQRVGRIIPSDKVASGFVYHVCNASFFIDSMKKELIGSDPPNISSAMFENMFIPLPPIPEQRQIAEILTTVDEKIGVLQDKKAQYQTLKRGLMQQLLTGQRRVRVPALETAALV